MTPGSDKNSPSNDGTKCIEVMPSRRNNSVRYPMSRRPSGRGITRRAPQISVPKISPMETSKLGLEAALDAHEHAMFGIGSNGRVMLLNRGAEAVVREGDCLRLSNDRLLAAVARENRKLQQLLSDAVGMGFGPEQSSAMLLERTSGKKAMRVTTTRFVSTINGSSMALAALVFVSDPEGVPRSRATLMRWMYGLTPAEARVADLLLQGFDAGEAATRLGLTLGTVRLQTKRVMAKTGTRRQAELMRLGLSLPVVEQG